MSKAENKGKRQAGTAPCLDPPLALLGTSDMHPLLHPPSNPAGAGDKLKLKGRNKFALNHILCWAADDAEASEDGKVPMSTLSIALWDPAGFARTGALMLCLLAAWIWRRTLGFILMAIEKTEVQWSNSSMMKCPTMPEDHYGIYIYFKTISCIFGAWLLFSFNSLGWQ